MASSSQPATEESVVSSLMCAYLVFALVVVYASEVMVAGLWLAGIRPQRFGDSFMWPGSWGWTVGLAFSFGLIFGLAAAAGVAIRAGFLQFKKGFPAALPAWTTLLACVVGEALHWHGYIGWEHIMKT
jgi:hypothetical protein